MGRKGSSTGEATVSSRDLHMSVLCVFSPASQFPERGSQCLPQCVNLTASPCELNGEGGPGSLSSQFTDFDGTFSWMSHPILNWAMPPENKLKVSYQGAEGQSPGLSKIGEEAWEYVFSYRLSTSSVSCPTLLLLDIPSPEIPWGLGQKGLLITVRLCRAWFVGHTPAEVHILPCDLGQVI